MKPLLVSHSDTSAGAYRAAVRLLQALQASNIDALMYVVHKTTDYPYIEGLAGKTTKIFAIIKNLLGTKIQRLQTSNNPIIHSGNWFGNGPLLKKINNSKADVVHLHWCNAESLSIKQISQINKPRVMTLHDMWAFCGGEHYANDEVTARFRHGYLKTNIPQDQSGIDLDRIIWQRKEKYWQKPFHLVTPSRWMANCVAESKLFAGWPVRAIPYAIDTELYKPVDKRLCRELLGLPQDIPLIGFGAVTGTTDIRKGFDLLTEALKIVTANNKIADLACVIIGQNKPKEEPSINVPIHYLGYLYDEISTVLFYNAIDLMIVPSRQESFGQTASEPQACGTPAVAFNCTGLMDVIEHGVTGYLATPFEAEDLALGIEKLLTDTASYQHMQLKARQRAVELWSQPVVANQHLEVFQQAITNAC